MLRKMSKAFEKDQSRDDIMASVPNSSSESLAQKSGLFRFPALFVRLSTKGLLDSDSVWSPTSPLDYKFFSNIGSSGVRSPRSPGHGGQQKSWGCNRVGLGLVDTLNDENMASHNKNVLLGSELKNNNIPGYKPKVVVMPGNSVVVAPEFLPEADNTCIQAPARSCSQLGQPMELDSDKVEKQIVSFDDVPKSSMPMSVPNYSSDGLISLSMSDIPQSEDYTCIISYGPNPKTTHIFGDLILETHTSRSLTLDSNIRHWEGKEDFPRVVKSSENLPFYPCNDLFSFCCSCKKKLKEGKDIYIYLGEKAFCSIECRENFIAEETQEEECMINSPGSPDPSLSEDCIFQLINH